MIYPKMYLFISILWEKLKKKLKIPDNWRKIYNRGGDDFQENIYPNQTNCIANSLPVTMWASEPGFVCMGHQMII